MVSTKLLGQTIKGSTINIAQKVQAALWCAQREKRLVIGLNESIKILAEKSENSLFCIMVQSTEDRKSMHMNEVLLEAFCHEHDVYVIKVNASDKLARILGIKNCIRCVLIQKSNLNMDNFTAIENDLIDYCEEHWNESNQATIILP